MALELTLDGQPLARPSDVLVGSFAGGFNRVFRQSSSGELYYIDILGQAQACTPELCVLDAPITGDPARDAQLAVDVQVLQGAELNALLGPVAGAELGSTYQGPTLTALTTAANLSGVGVLPILEAQPTLAAAIRLEAEQDLATRLANGDLGVPSDNTLFSPFERTLQRITDSQRVQPFVDQATARAGGELVSSIFGDFSDVGLSSGSFTSFEDNLPSPFGVSQDAFGTTGTAGSVPISSNGGGSLLESILAGAVSLIPALSRAGVIRGTVGSVFGGGGNGSVGAAPMGMVAAQPAQQFGGGSMALSLQDALQSLVMSANANIGGQLAVTDDAGMPSQNVQWPVSPAGLLGNCGRSRTRYVDMGTAPGLYALGCNGYKPVSKVVAQSMDGSRDLFIRVGKIISPSQKALQRAARQLARQAHCTVSSSSSRRYSRRVYRRRRPR